MAHPALAEDKRLRMEFDEDCSFGSPNDEPTDWGSDPMEILMRKQELERNELEAATTWH